MRAHNQRCVAIRSRDDFGGVCIKRRAFPFSGKYAVCFGIERFDFSKHCISVSSTCAQSHTTPHPQQLTLSRYLQRASCTAPSFTVSSWPGFVTAV